MEQGYDPSTEANGQTSPQGPVPSVAPAPVVPPIIPPVIPNSAEPTSYPSFLHESSSADDPKFQEASSISPVSEVEPQVSAPILPQGLEPQVSAPILPQGIEPQVSAPILPQEIEPQVPVIPPQVDTPSQMDSPAPSEAAEQPNNDAVSRMTAPPISTIVSDTPQDEEVSISDTSAPSDSESTPPQDNEAASEEADSSSDEESGEEPAVSDYKSATFLDDLFANGNTCLTMVNGSFSVKEETRSLLALFSNGRFFVSETARFDGKVLGFEYLANKRHLQLGKPEYVPQMVIADIYDYANRQAQNTFVPQTVETDVQDQVRMQRDFVTIITKAASQHVSDIHIVVADHTTIMFRINGLMQTEMEYNKEWGESFVRAAFASADISDANYAQNEYQAAQKLGRTPLRGSGGRLILPRNILGIRLQFNPIAFGTRYVVMRLLYAEDDVRDSSNLGVLGFTKHDTDLFFQLRSMPTGIVVISGPTGSGKSTTLQRNMIAMLQERNYEINLITVEDPPEYPIPGARQMPVTNADSEETKDREFTKALSAALRSDPDALMIGEIRALAAADLAFRGALSGHNVWTTLHANSASAILMRLKDIGVEDFKLQDPSIIKGLIAQRLFRKLCPVCRVRALDRLDHPAVQRLRRAFGDIALEQSYLKGPGCEACDFLGVKGRTVVGEFILPDTTFLDLSIRGESKKAHNYWINDLNGITLRDAAISRMLAGIIDIEEVERWTGFLDQQILA